MFWAPMTMFDPRIASPTPASETKAGATMISANASAGIL
jgi:hypothetical protein